VIVADDSGVVCDEDQDAQQQEHRRDHTGIPPYHCGPVVVRGGWTRRRVVVMIGLDGLAAERAPSLGEITGRQWAGEDEGTRGNRPPPHESASDAALTESRTRFASRPELPSVPIATGSEHDESAIANWPTAEGRSQNLGGVSSRVKCRIASGTEPECDRTVEGEQR
jgi:hypothetical protein